MEVPTSFKTNIAKTFFTKQVEKLNWSETTDAEGGANKSVTGVAFAFNANVQPLTTAERVELNGLNIQADIRVTCPEDTDVKTGARIRTGGKDYEVVESLPLDSHRRILARRWEP